MRSELEEYNREGLASHYSRLSHSKNASFVVKLSTGMVAYTFKATPPVSYAFCSIQQLSSPTSHLWVYYSSGQNASWLSAL